MKYPIDCTTPKERSEFLYKLQETLRLEHNSDETQKLSKKQFEIWVKGTWKERSDNVIKEILKQRALASDKVVEEIQEEKHLLKSSTKWNPKLTDADLTNAD